MRSREGHLLKKEKSKNVFMFVSKNKEGFWKLILIGKKCRRDASSME